MEKKWDLIKVKDNELIIMNPKLTPSKPGTKVFKNFEKIQFKKPYGYKLSINVLNFENFKNFSSKLILLNESGGKISNPCSLESIEPLEIKKRKENKVDLNLEIVFYFSYNTTSFLMKKMNFRLGVEMFSDSLLLSSLKSPKFVVKSKKEIKIKKHKNALHKNFSNIEFNNFIPKVEDKKYLEVKEYLNTKLITEKINKNIEYINFLNFKGWV
jgi:hypothetical protein